MSNTLTGLWSAVNKPKSEEKRRPKKPEDPAWKEAKGYAVLTCGAAGAYLAISALSYATHAQMPPVKEVPTIAIFAWATARGGRNVHKTFKAAAESGDYNYKSQFNIAQPPPATSLNLSYRENYNTVMLVGLGLMTAGAMAPSVVGFSMGSMAFAGFFQGRRSRTAPEGEQGHLRPKWLRDAMNGGGGKGGGPSGP